MPPAAVDFQSQSTRHQQGLSFDPQNPSSRFSNKPRPKPRLPKRRHVAKANTGLIPSRPCLHDLNRAKFDLSGSVNGFVFGSTEGSFNSPNLNLPLGKKNEGYLGEDEFGVTSKEGFVSGAQNNCSNLKKSEPVGGFVNGFSLNSPNLNLKMGKINEGILGEDRFSVNLKEGFVSGGRNDCWNLKKSEPVSGLSNGFSFGFDTIGSGLNNPDFNLQMKQNFYCRETSKNSVPSAGKSFSDFKNTESVGSFSSRFVFGSGESVLESLNLTKEMKQNNKSCSNFEKAESFSGLSNEFVFGTSVSGLKNPNLNVETKQKDMGFSNLKSECKESKKNDEFGKVLNGGFVFATGKGCSNLRKTESVRRNPDTVRFGFVAKRGDSKSDLNSTKEESGKNIENLISETKEKAEVGCERKNGTSFGFGGNRCELGSTFCKTSSQISENGEKSVPINTEKVDDIFVFGCSRKGSSSSRDFSKFGDMINKSEAENCNGNISVDNDTHRSDSFVNNKQNFVPGSKTCAPELNTTDELLDEMRKLRVTDSNEKGKNFGDIKEPLIYSRASSDPMFVFGSDRNPSASSTGESGSTKLKNAKSVRLFENFEENPPTSVNRRSSNNTSIGISTPISFTFQAGTGTGKNSVEFKNQVNDDPKSNIFFSKSLFSSDLFDVEGFSMGRVEGKDNVCFVSMLAGAGSCATGFRTPNRDASNSFAENISTGFSKYPGCSEKSRSMKNRKCKKLSQKSKRIDRIQQQPSKSNEGSQQNAESPGHFSPMDFSPYQNDQCAPSTNATDSGLARDEAAKKGADTSRGEKKTGQANEEFSKSFWERFAAEYAFEQAETLDRSSRMGQVSANNDNNTDSVPDATSRNTSNLKPEVSYHSSAEGTVRNFGSFTVSKEDNISDTKSGSRKKYRKKVGCGPTNIDPRCQVGGSYLHPNNAQNKERNTNNSQRMVDNSVKVNEEHSNQRSATARKVNEEHVTQWSTAEVQNACEKWRIRGNQAYQKGNSSKAEEYYTKGIESFVHKGSPECSNEPLVLCYSNRAAARMLCGRMREALSDCVMADSLDPSFQKVQLRAANCHLALGEIEEACQYFSRCLGSKGVCLDRRCAIEAASGLQKAQKFASCLSHCAELLRQKTSTAANSALESISAIFPTCSYSEKLLELKGEALLMLQRYKDVIQLCEQTLVPAEKNFSMVADDTNSVNVNAPNSKNSSIMLWRWRVMSKSYFYLGRLELALECLEKQEISASTDDRSNTKESPFLFAATVRELLHHKSAGNRAFQSGKHTAAVEHYSAAVSSSIESRPFAAVCFCNRAAAQQALGQLSDAISDCSIAIALDGSYSKAVSRRATLHEKIRDYASATSDYERLISLLKEQSQGNNCGSAGAETSSGNKVEELRQACSRLSSIEEKAKKGLPLDHYLILGVKSTDETSELRKAYRRAALRHHPDKAGQFLAKGDNGDDGRPWKEICEEIQKDADRLFKMIGEAYAVLSDPSKKSEYDLQEELRKARKENRNRDSTEPYSFYNTSSKNRRNNGRYWQESYKTYGYSRSQW